jgi:hypothetical protein
MRPHAELIKRWADDGTMEIEVLSDKDKWEPVPTPWWNPDVTYRIKPKEKKKVSKWLWAIQIGEETLLSVYFCADEQEVYKRYNAGVVILCRIEGSKIEVE